MKHMNKLFFKPCMTVMLIAMILSGCNKDDDQAIVVDSSSFFKVNVATETFGENELNMRTTSVSADTIITPLENGLYMETVVNQDIPAETATRATRADMATGTILTILAYKTSGTYVGRMEGEVQANGSVQIRGQQLTLTAGSYNFVCVANGTIDGNNNFIAKSGFNSMVSTIVPKTITAGDENCILSFYMQHKVSQIKVTLVSNPEVGEFSGLSASLNSSSYPTEEKLLLPSCEIRNYQSRSNLNQAIITNMSGSTVVSQIPNYFVGGNGLNLWNDCQLKLKFTAGQFGATSMLGKSIDLTTLSVKDNQISNIKITIKAGFKVNFRTENVTKGTVSVAQVIGSENNPFTVNAIRGTGYTFEGWYDESDNKILQNETFVGVFNVNNNNKTYTARFRSRVADDLDFTIASGNLKYENGVYSFSTNPAGGSNVNNEKWQLMMLEPGNHPDWREVNTNDPLYGDPCQKVPVAAGETKWYTPSPEQLMELKETGWSYVASDPGIGNMTFNLNAPGKEIRLPGTGFLDQTGVLWPVQPATNGVLYRTVDADHNYYSRRMVALSGASGHTDWIIWERTVLSWCVGTAVSLRCIR